VCLFSSRLNGAKISLFADPQLEARALANEEPRDGREFTSIVMMGDAHGELGTFFGILVSATADDSVAFYCRIIPAVDTIYLVLPASSNREDGADRIRKD
jgi:hypothetical protein